MNHNQIKRVAMALSIAASIGTLGLAAEKTATKEKVVIGKPAPAFTLVDAKNKKVSLADFKKQKKRVVLLFARAHW